MGWMGEFWARWAVVSVALTLPFLKQTWVLEAALIEGAVWARLEQGGRPLALLCMSSWVAFFC